MALQPLEPWVSLEVLMGMPLSARVMYVRKNLATPRGGTRHPYMTHDDFAEAVGATNRKTPITWEKGTKPRDYAARIAALTPYPATAFGAAGEADLVQASLGSRLESLEETVEELHRIQQALLDELGLAPGRGGKLAPRAARARSSAKKTRGKAAS